MRESRFLKMKKMVLLAAGLVKVGFEDHGPGGIAYSILSAFTVVQEVLEGY